MLYTMAVFRLLLLFFAYLPVDVIIFCKWHVSHFPCILKPLYFIKSCSVHKEKPEVYNLGMVGKKICGDCKLWCYWYLDNWVLKKMYKEGFKNCSTYCWFWDNKWDYPSCQIVKVISLSNTPWQMKLIDDVINLITWVYLGKVSGP